MSKPKERPSEKKLFLLRGLIALQEHLHLCGKALKANVSDLRFAPLLCPLLKGQLGEPPETNTQASPAIHWGE